MKKIILAILLIAEIIMIGSVYSENITSEISGEILRMHILANSDSAFDQETKLKVRDYILSYVDKEQIRSKNEVVNSIKKMEESVNELLNNEDIKYLCEIEYTNSVFETKTYSDLSIPAGEYESLKVILGNGEGKNWWCVAYPPLCFTESVIGKISDDGNKKLYEILTEETYNILKKDSVDYKIKFKAIEILNSIFKWKALTKKL